MISIQIQLLGSFQLKKEGAVVRLRSKRIVALLIYLISQTRPVPREELAELLWADKEPKLAKTNLRWAISQLKKLLGDALLTDRKTVTFVAESHVLVDVLLVDRMLHSGEVLTWLSHIHPHYMTGFFFDESPEFETWLVSERERWAQKLCQALHQLIIHLQQINDLSTAIQCTRQLLTIDNWQEDAHRLLMTLLARQGQVAEALAQYEQCRHLLRTELGVEPDRDTQALYHRLQRLIDAPPYYLPAQPTPFVGRQQEITQLVKLLEQTTTRLITIMGAGGMGKTRLAIQVGRQLTAAFLDGVVFISLVGVETAEYLPAALLLGLENAGILSLSNEQTPEHYLYRQLQDKEMLLILDNFEHLLAGTPFITHLLEQLSNLKLIITSRERLRLRWEIVIELTGLTEQASSRQLFQQTAERVQSDFSLTPANESAINHIIQLVGAMPLALEIAASWVRLHSCAEIAQEIERGLDILTATTRDLPARQQSIRVLFDYSWEQLSEQEQQVLAKLSFFRGGFTLEAGQIVAGATPNILLLLLDKSLLAEMPASTPRRYTIHELLRQYASEKVTSAVPIQDKHSHYFIQFLHQHDEGIRHGHKKAYQVVIQEIDNIRLAWRWICQQKEITAMAQCYETLGFFYDRQGWWEEGENQFAQAIQAVRALLPSTLPQIPYLLIGLLISRAGQLNRLHQNQLAKTLLQEALASAKPLNFDYGLFFGTYILGRTHFMLNELEEAYSQLQQSLNYAQKINHTAGKIWVLNNLGAVTLSQWQFEESVNYSEQCIQFYRQNGDLRGLVVAQTNIALAHLFHFNFTRAKVLFEQNLEIAEQMVEETHLFGAIYNLAYFYLHQKEGEKTKELVERFLRHTQKPVTVPHPFYLLSRVAILEGNVSEAMRYAQDTYKLSKWYHQIEWRINACLLFAELYLHNDEQVVKWLNEALLHNQTMVSQIKMADIALIYAQWQHRLGNTAAAYLAVYWIVGKKDCYYDTFHEAVLREKEWGQTLSPREQARLQETVEGMLKQASEPFPLWFETDNSPQV